MMSKFLVVSVIVALAAAGYYFFGPGSSVSPEEARALAERRAAVEEGQRKAAAHQEAVDACASWQTAWLKLPEPVIARIVVDGFDVATGAASEDLMGALSVTRQERDRISKRLLQLLDEFQEVEVQHAKVAEQPQGSRYVALAGCEEPALPLFDSFRKDLTTILGRDRATTLYIMVRRELRNGGRDAAALGYETQGSARNARSGLAQANGSFTGYDRAYGDVKLSSLRRWEKAGRLLDSKG